MLVEKDTVIQSYFLYIDRSGEIQQTDRMIDSTVGLEFILLSTRRVPLEFIMLKISYWDVCLSLAFEPLRNRRQFFNTAAQQIIRNWSVTSAEFNWPKRRVNTGQVPSTGLFLLRLNEKQSCLPRDCRPSFDTKASASGEVIWLAVFLIY